MRDPIDSNITCLVRGLGRTSGLQCGRQRAEFWVLLCPEVFYEPLNSHLDSLNSMADTLPANITVTQNSSKRGINSTRVAAQQSQHELLELQGDGEIVPALPENPKLVPSIRMGQLTTTSSGTSNSLFSPRGHYTHEHTSHTDTHTHTKQMGKAVS